MSKQSRDRQEPRKPPVRFQPSGVTNLDQILGGGLPRGALMLIVGMPGSGKTTMANQIAFAGAHAGRRSLVLTALSEGTGKLIEHLRTYTFFQEEFVGDAVQFGRATLTGEMQGFPILTNKEPKLTFIQAKGVFFHALRACR